MTDLLVPLVVGLAALAGSMSASVVGFGAAIILLPAMVWAFGVRDAIPILTVVQLIGNFSRVYFNRKELVLPVVGWFALGAVPGAALGAVFFVVAPAPLLNRLMGAFLLAAVAFRRTDGGRQARIGLRGFAAVGALLGCISALVGTGGPMAAPFFLSYGLMKGSFIGTDALAAAVTHSTKLAVYSSSALLAPQSMTVGATTGVMMVAGAFIGKSLMDRLPERVFRGLIEAVMIASGLQLLIFS